MVGEDSRILSMKAQNLSIKLDLFLENCVENDFLFHFLKYKIDDAEGNKDILIDRIISNYDLKSIINYRYKYNTSKIDSILESFFSPLKVVDIFFMAKKYDVEVSASKDQLKNNFLEKFQPYDLILTLNDEGLDLKNYLDISVLEQIYLLGDLKLEENIIKCPHIENSRCEMISCIVNYYDDEFLVSNNKLDIGDDAK